MIRSMLLITACSLAIGCTSNPTGTVSGEVNLDGQPVKNGMIQFIPSDDKSSQAAGGGEITDGKFRVTVPVGSMKVAISAAKSIGKKKMYDTPDSPTVEETVEMIPEKYNVKSELQVTVKGGDQSEKFDLKSK